MKKAIDRLDDKLSNLRPFAGSAIRFSVCGSIFGFAFYPTESCSNEGNWSRRDRLPKAVGSSQASCE